MHIDRTRDRLVGSFIHSIGWVTALTAATLLGLFAPKAEASRARILALGSGDPDLVLAPAGNGGSLLIDDSYNIFYNPSYIVDFRDGAIIEKSNFPGSSASGGFTTSLMAFALGFYFNRTAALEEAFDASGAADEMRPFEVFLGADMGVKWGLGMTLGNYDAAGADNTSVTLRFGAQAGGFEPFINWTAVGERAGADDFTDVLSGIRYHYGEWTPYLVYRRTDVTGIFTNRLGFGIARTARVAEGVDMNSSFSYWRDTQQSRNIVPIEISLEARTLSWLTLRGGLNYRLVDEAGGVSFADTAAARFGAGVFVGKASLDWVVGRGAAGPTGGYDTQVFGLSQGFFTAASVGYSF